MQKPLLLRDRFSWAEELFRESYIFQTQEQIQAAVQRVAIQIRREMSMLFPVILTVMSGASVFCSDLMRYFDFPLDFDYLDVSRYRESTHPGDLHWLAKPSLPLEGRRVLVVDDILDQGLTLHAIHQWLMEQGVLDVKIAVLCERQQFAHTNKRVVADYKGIELSNNAFIFGYGMDIYGFWRNLPAIYQYLPGQKKTENLS